MLTFFPINIFIFAGSPGLMRYLRNLCIVLPCGMPGGRWVPGSRLCLSDTVTVTQKKTFFGSLKMNNDKMTQFGDPFR
jgi:hypothetical protein